jgi:hypothetical protein
VSEERKSDTNDPICGRLAAIIEDKRHDNDEAIGSLKTLESKWKSLNKELDVDIGAEFNLADVERTEALTAKDKLDKVTVLPSDDGFVLGGRIVDQQKKAGLSHVAVRLLRGKGTKTEVLAETVANQTGGFAVLVPKALLREPGAATESIRIEAVAGPGMKPITVVEKPIAMKSGKAETIEIALPTTKKTADRLNAAKAFKDSVIQNLDGVEAKITSMKKAHTALTKFAELTRDGLRDLRSDLAAPAPRIAAAVPIGDLEPPRPIQAPVGVPTPAEPAEVKEDKGPAKKEAAKKRAPRKSPPKGSAPKKARKTGAKRTSKGSRGKGATAKKRTTARRKPSSKTKKAAKRTTKKATAKRPTKTRKRPTKKTTKKATSRSPKKRTDR